MLFASVTADLPTREQSLMVEIMYYVTRVANPMFLQDGLEFEAKLLYNVRARFGDDIDIVYLDMNGDPCEIATVDRARIHLVEDRPTVH
jgi:hypothetical protein